MHVHGHLPDLSSRRNRGFVYSGDRNSGVLVVTGDGGGLYLLEWEQPDPELPPQPPAALLARQDDTDAAVYRVRLGRRVCCDCRGFQRWGRCKHQATVTEIAAAVGICENRGDDR